MTGLQLYGIAGKIIFLAVLGLLQPQDTTDLPMTKKEVQDLFIKLKGQPALKNATKEEVERVGVAFVLDPATEQEFHHLGMDQDLLNAIREHVTTLTVLCEPVECGVTINNEPAGQTFATTLTKAPVKPGSVTVTVAAANYETQTKQLRVAPGAHVTVPKFTLIPSRGALTIACAPAPVCEIAVTGNGVSQKGQATQQPFTLQGLPLGKYEVQVSAPPAFLPKTEEVWINSPDVRAVTIKLEEDPWGSKTDQEVLKAVVDSLGGDAIFRVGAASKNTGRMRLVDEPPEWNAQVVEYLSANRLRWDLTIAASKWSVIFDGAKVSSNGDKKRYSGTEFAQELEHSIRLFSMMRLPSLLSLIQAKFDVKKGPELVLIATSENERFTFRLNADYTPIKVLHEHLTAPRSQEEIEFAQYKSIGQNLKLPHVIILRYPDRPKHEHTFEYDDIDTNAQIKETLFKLK